MASDSDSTWAPGNTDPDSADEQIIYVSASDSLGRPRKRRRRADPDAFISKHGIIRPVHVSATVLAAWDARLRIMMSTREHSDEFAKLRTWFSIFAEIPWGVRSTPPAVPLQVSMDAMDTAIYGPRRGQGSVYCYDGQAKG